MVIGGKSDEQARRVTLEALILQACSVMGGQT